jgi:hypothetical protein
LANALAVKGFKVSYQHAAHANLEFAGKSGDEIPNQLVLWLIEKGVLIPGPNNVIPEGAKNILVNRGFGLRS